MTKIIPQGHRTIIRYVRIYLDDIISIIGIMQNNCESIKVYGDGYELENPLKIDEYRNLTKKQFYSLTIRATNPNVSFEVAPVLFNGIGISVDSDDVKSIGVFKKIEDIIKKRRRIFFEFVNSFKFFIIILLLINLIMAIMSAYFKIENIVKVEINLICFTIFILNQSFQIKSRKVVYINKYISEESNFIARNKDRIALGIITALLGAFFALVVQWLVKKL